MSFRMDPGPCPICGAEHTTCTAGTGPITSVMVPARDATRTVEIVPVPLVAEIVQKTLPEGSFTTAHYKGDGKRKR